MGMIPDTGIFSVKDGALFIEGIEAAELARRFGTPLYVYSKAGVLSRCRELRALSERWGGRVRAAYASKAFLTPSFARLVAEEGLHLDVVSGGELYTALKGGFAPERITFHGNAKTQDELLEAISRGVGRIAIDADWEMDAIEDICAGLGRRQGVLFRVTPGVAAHTHEKIQTGHHGSKFGIPMDDAVLLPLAERAFASGNVDLLGLHAHIGSQIFEAEPYVEAAERLFGALLAIRERTGRTLAELAIGGGFGARYTEGERRQPYAFFIDPVMDRLAALCRQHGIDAPLTLGIEPGRSVVAEAGVQLYSVVGVKEIPGVPTYVAVDGGMSDNIRPALYGAKYEAVLANKAGEPPAQTVTVCGKLCESGDRIIDDARLAKAERGDTLCVFSTGAYGYSMASNYNKLPKAAAVLADGTDVSVLARRQSYADMTACEE